MKSPLRVALVSSALGLSLLTACGGDGGGGDTQAYCNEIKDVQSTFEAFEQQDADALKSALASLQTLGDEAPAEIKDEWDTLQEGFKALSDALEGVDLEALQDDPAKAMEAMEAMGKAMEDIDQDALEAAGDKIAEHAQDKCDVDLDL